MEKMDKEEKSLLLFLETRAVDYSGRVNLKHMNSDDIKIAERWNKEKFIEFGRIVLRHHNSDGTHYCKLSDKALKLAHKERRARILRMLENRNWISTEESIEINGDPRFSGLNKQNKVCTY